MKQEGSGISGSDGGTVAAVMRLTDLAARIERVESDSARRAGELARDCDAARRQVTVLRDELGTLDSRADEIEQRLAEVSRLLGHMSGQLSELLGPEREPRDDGPAYQVNPVPPWWNPADGRCRDAAARLKDWVSEVYRPVFGYLAGLLAPCWAQHPLCLAYLDAVHEAWCLMYIPARDPKMVFAQLDWLTRPLLQAAEVMSAETKACRDRGSHCAPGQRAAAGSAPAWLTTRR